MAAIYKKELRSYFTSMTGYICMAFMLVVIGIYYAVINLASGYPYFGYTLSCVIVLFLLMTPVLTMRILAEEKSRKTDQLLLTAPVSLWKIVVGKYLAMVTVFGLALLVTCFYPLILSRFGTVSLSMAYTAILGYFLSILPLAFSGIRFTRMHSPGRIYAGSLLSISFRIWFSFFGPPS